MKGLYLVIAALLVTAAGRGMLRGTPAEPQSTFPPTSDSTLLDFDRFQRAVGSQNRRMDALESTLGGLCALGIRGNDIHAR
jgi:hypothetical protein